MLCKKIRELLKSGYLDGEISRTEQQYIKGHLAHCPGCGGLEKELQAQRMLFQKAKQQQVPERVWQNIHDAIVAEGLNQEGSVIRGLLRRLRELIWAPRPVFALAGALTLIIFVAVFAGLGIRREQSFSRNNGTEGIADYRLSSESEELLSGLGTEIEEYFL